MKKYFNKIFILMLVVASVSCSEDTLTNLPTDSVAPDNALSSPENMIAALNGVHRAMYSQSDLGDYNYAGESYIMPMLDFPAGDMLHSGSGNGWFKYTLKWLRHTNPNSGDMAFVWYHYYHLIGNVNNIINAAEGMTDTPALSNVLGQAYAYRAWLHHRLVCLFAKNYIHGNPSTDLGVPIMLKTDPAELVGQARETVENVYKQIEKDLAASLAYFENADDPNNKSHISINVANGIAARVALTKGDYVAAATYANAARSGYSLMNEADYKIGFNSVNLSEVMWGAEVVDSQTNYYYSWFYYQGTNFNGSQNRSNPKFINHNLFAEISDTDYRKDMWLEKAPNDFVGWEADPNYATKEEFNAAFYKIVKDYNMTTSFYTNAYMSVKFLNKDGGTINPDDVFYMRSSEMYLIEAEALAMQEGKDVEAQNVINELVTARTRSGETPALITTTGDALVQDILIQRRIELWGEGHRWLDMLRLDLALDLTGSGASSTLYQKGYSQAKPSVNNNWLFQIPQEEVDANPLMEPNPVAEL
ncbi:RagB/SusD family nutrient uptake outer membrane protein [Ancylomarina sp. 16SWW S1-10-2]|uniref:RagB/SusD family nutrient uptake outer membrane protein n=1 Tax=Ancylomarina sp. 16SWW S1-10-2 TaxID=2499681 RepID=UPI0012AE2092|nr:RagB/SusD family nutrient uptake outer membrane protein [Ancylomarina sp. 16SWW S1-10-2]MRT91409.1 RagB/SusD family nutrient uptake outer membrane protein [Ancylomarina sp. 16SWW S1-10-2]